MRCPTCRSDSPESGAQECCPSCVGRVLAELAHLRAEVGTLREVAAAARELLVENARPQLKSYLALERAVAELDPWDEESADSVRDVMDVVWDKLSDEEHAQLDAREE